MAHVVLMKTETVPRFYLGFIIWGRRPEWPKATSLLEGSAPPPRRFFEMNMRWDAIWCILRHNFEKCYSVCTNLVASWWFFRYSYLYTVFMTIFLGGKLGILGGGSFYPSNTLDRTLPSIFCPEIIRILFYFTSRGLKQTAMHNNAISALRHVSGLTANAQ